VALVNLFILCSILSMIAHKGRGAPANQMSTRFALPQATMDDDWLDTLASDPDQKSPPLQTIVTMESARRIISTNTSPDIGFDQSINVYRGCEHGCIYCFARPTHAWLDLSPGLDFESRLFAKPDAPALLRRELGRKGYAPKTIAMGTNTDPYQPIEAHHQLTRACITVLANCRHPLMITTKSDRVLRDLDLLASMAKDGLVAVGISITTLDPVLARIMEPRAAHPTRRLKAVEKLAVAGVPVNVCASPIIPAINDHEIEALVAAAAGAGAQSVSSIPVRLPHEVAPLFRAWLMEHFPDRAARVMHHIQTMRGGRDNDPSFGSRMRGSGAYADLVRQRFALARRKYALASGAIILRKDLFEPPSDQPLLL
jgi:DNA repair photolyase